MVNIYSAAASPIVTHKLRDNIVVLEGSGGTIAVLTGPDGKVLIDADTVRHQAVPTLVPRKNAPRQRRAS